MPRDWLDARFEKAARKERGRTGLERTDTYYHICPSCKQTVINHSPTPPKVCSGKQMISGRPCFSTRFETYNDIAVEAMPIGRVVVDLRRKT